MNNKTDLSTILGIILALSFVGLAIFIGGNSKGFIDLPSFLIVILGTYALTIASFSLAETMKAQLLVGKTMFYSAEDPSSSAKKILELAEISRKKGFLGLQQFANIFKQNRFLEKGVTLIIDGAPHDEIEKILVQEIYAMNDRHSKSSSVFKKSAEISPAMGLIGTLIGLVQMLSQLDEPSKIGPAMAVALLTTFYGAVMAYMVYLPLSAKLDRNSKEETISMNIYLKGITSIAKKKTLEGWKFF